MNAREKIRAAAHATKLMDQLLDPALDDLRNALRDGNGAGIYFDISRVRSALQNMKVAIIKAQEIDNNAHWPTPQEYDES